MSTTCNHDARIADLEHKLLDHEAKLVEQEHRRYRIFWTLLWDRRAWPDNDPRRRAAWAAAIADVLRQMARTPAIIAVAGGGFAALVGAIFALHANILLATQNRMVAAQTELAESARRSALIFELTAILDQIDREVIKANESDKGTYAEGLPVRLSDRTYGRIIALSRSLRPYRYLNSAATHPAPNAETSPQRLIADVRDTMSTLVDTFGGTIAADSRFLQLSEHRSPERGQLLLSLLTSGIEIGPAVAGSYGTDYQGAKYGGASFDYADLRSAVLVKAPLRMINLSHADLGEAVLTGTDLYAADLVGVNLRKADLTDVILVNADLHEATLDGAVNLTQQQVDLACCTPSTILPKGIVLKEPSDDCIALTQLRHPKLTRNQWYFLPSSRTAPLTLPSPSQPMPVP